jgi:hypothetical protein
MTFSQLLVNMTSVFTAVSKRAREGTVIVMSPLRTVVRIIDFTIEHVSHKARLIV